jgi:hypothetical protein
MRGEKVKKTKNEKKSRMNLSEMQKSENTHRGAIALAFFYRSSHLIIRGEGREDEPRRTANSKKSIRLFTLFPPDEQPIRWLGKNMANDSSSLSCLKKHKLNFAGTRNDSSPQYEGVVSPSLRLAIMSCFSFFSALIAS